MAAALFSLFTNLLVLAIPLYTLQVYDRVLGSRSLETLAMLTVAAMGALVFLGLLEAVRGRLMTHVAAWLDRRWAPALMARAVEAAAGGTEGSAQGLRDLAVLRAFVGGPGMLQIFDAPWLPLYVAAMFLLHTALGWLALGGAALLLAIAVAAEAVTRRPFQSAARRVNSLLRRADSVIRNAEVVEAMGMMPAIRRRWGDENMQAADLMTRASRRAASLSALARFLRLAVQVAVIALGAKLALAQEITPGAMIAATVLLSRALAPVEQLVGQWRSVVAARAARDRIADSLARPAMVRAATRLPQPAGHLSLERVSLSVPGREAPILDGIDLDIRPGESLGVIGPSAAGKTSLARVILGVRIPTAGRARLDGADLAAWSRDDLGAHVGYLPQAIDLFAGTVKDNIARMAEAADADVIAAARLAGVHEMILRLPLGYDTEVGEATLALSGGQRQRVGIARAFFGEPRLLVLDEPNSNLDAEGENALIRALMQARERRITSVIIAHRPRVLTTVDKILFLRDGRIEMFGDRDAVLARVLPQPRAVEGDGRRAVRP